MCCYHAFSALITYFIIVPRAAPYAILNHAFGALGFATQHIDKLLRRHARHPFAHTPIRPHAHTPYPHATPASSSAWTLNCRSYSRRYTVEESKSSRWVPISRI